MNPKDSAAILAAYQRHASPAVREQMLDWVVETAQGATLHGADGLQLIDMASGGFGFGHPRVKAAVAEKVRTGPLSSRILINRGLAQLVVKLAEIAPGDLSVSYVCNSGEEALDSALKLAKGHWPDRHKVVTAIGSDHGTLSHGVYFADIGSRYLSGLTLLPQRVPFDDLKATLQAIDGNTSAVLLEPLSLDHGHLAASAAYWQAVRARCDATGALLIVNELRTGLGRSGRTFAIEASGICPDVLVVGGALSGGQVSVGAYITKEAINSKVYGRKNPSLHGSTTGANPASCAAALATLAVMQEDGLAAHHQALGQQTLAWLSAPDSGLGRHLMQIQTVGSMTALDFDSTLSACHVRQRALAQGLWLRPPVGARLVLNPPLTISLAEHQAGVHMLMAAIRELSGAAEKTHYLQELSHEPS